MTTAGATTLTVEPVAGALGATVTGIDLAEVVRSRPSWTTCAGPWPTTSSSSCPTRTSASTTSSG